MRYGVMASAARKNLARVYDEGLLPIETIRWQRHTYGVNPNNPAIQAGLLPVSMAPAWDSKNVSSTGGFVRNADRSLVLTNDNRAILPYTGADLADSSDFEDIGIAYSGVGPDLTVLTKLPANPVIEKGTPPAIDAGDAQRPQGWLRGPGDGLLFYHGNSTPTPDTVSGDHVTLCLARTTNWETYTNRTRIVDYGPDGGDVDGVYGPCFVPVGHDGKPWLFGTGKDASGKFGLMAYRSAGGNWEGPYTRVQAAHLFEHFDVVKQVSLGHFTGDVLFEDGLYHILYFPASYNGIGDTFGGVFYATWDGVSPTANQRRRIHARRGSNWDAGMGWPTYQRHAGRHYLITAGSTGSGIGYADANGYGQPGL